MPRRAAKSSIQSNLRQMSFLCIEREAIVWIRQGPSLLESYFQETLPIGEGLVTQPTKITKKRNHHLATFTTSSSDTHRPRARWSQIRSTQADVRQVLNAGMATRGENEQRTYGTLFCHSSQSLFSTNDYSFNQAKKTRNSAKCTKQSIINRCIRLCTSNWRVKNTGRKKAVYAVLILEFTVCCVYDRSSRESSIRLCLFTPRPMRFSGWWKILGLPSTYDTARDAFSNIPRRMPPIETQHASIFEPFCRC